MRSKRRFARRPRLDDRADETTEDEMLYTGITLAKRQHTKAYNVKIVVDASSPEEALEIVNSFLRERNATAKFNPALAMYRPFEGSDQFNFSISHPSVTIIDSLNK